MEALKTEKKTARLDSLKLYDTFGVEGSNRQYQFNGHMQNAGDYGVEDLMTGRRDVWLGRVMVVKLKTNRRGA